MAGKRSDDPRSAGANQDRLRAVRLELPEDVHRQLRLEAARQDRSLAALARLAVEDYLRRKASGK
jgi:hypothetical protein